MSSARALKRLKAEHKQFQKSPPSGFSAEPSSEDLLEWEVTIDGPVDSFFENGKYVAKLSFPPNYPMNPPQMTFKSAIHHPNIYPDGRVCLSILHAPGQDPFGNESSTERWNVVQNISSIIISVMSIMHSPNPNSPANVDAAKLFLNDHEKFVKKAKESANESRAIYERKVLMEEQNEEYASMLKEDEAKDKRKREEAEAEERDTSKRLKVAGHSTQVDSKMVEPTVVVTSVEADQTDFSVQEREASLKSNVNKEKPKAVVKVRLVDGSAVLVELNKSLAVGDVMAYVRIARPHYAGAEFILVSTDNHEQLLEENTLEEANIQDSVVLQQLK